MNTRALALGLLAFGCAPSIEVPERALAVRDGLEAHVEDLVGADALARPDGYVYAIDVGQLLLYAALDGERELYTTLRDRCLADFVHDDRSDELTRGFVAWRRRRGQPADASGTTEALVVARGLWEGAKTFQTAGDRERALVILRGYARHATVERGLWMIRNYFNFETRTFATNSFLVDYAPDFVNEVARETNDRELREIARRSYELLGRARSPSGLLYAVVQPELSTLMDERFAVFSPNDAIQLSNAAAAAEAALDGAPELGRAVLRFAGERMPELGLAYYGRTGERALVNRPGAETWAVLVRLAAGLRDRDALEAWLPRLLDTTRGAPSAYEAGQVLLALRSVEDAGGVFAERGVRAAER